MSVKIRGAIKIGVDKIRVAIKTIATLALLLSLLPINLMIVLVCLTITALRTSRADQSPASAPESVPKNILLTGGKMTKALQLARSFHGAGHRVFLVETEKYWLSGHRFSRAVSGFYTLPAPESDPDGYYHSLQTIVKQHEIDVFIPVSSPVASFHDAVATKGLPDTCQVIHASPTVVEQLDDKFLLGKLAQQLGLSAPRAFLITDVQQIIDFDFAAEPRQYILKSIRYNSVSRLNLTRLPCPNPEALEAYVKELPISEANPWVLQEFITGQEYCTHSTVRHGQIRLHCCSRSSPFQVNYQQVEHPEIFHWVETFVGALNLTGQISFDFIQAADGVVYPIECNPRTHSAITLFYNHPGVADAYLQDRRDESELPITPLANSRPTYWLYHELWRLTGVRSWADLQLRLQTLFGGKDAIFAVHDPLPFFAVPHWQVTLLLLQNLWQLKDWQKIDFNIGKLVEPGGD
jgi:predicted ATP-grasp superfamily ATP-dependent carboligase